MTVTIEVVDRGTGRPLDNVVVLLPDAGIQALTDVDGRARLQEIRRGTYRLVLTRQGYEKEEGDFAVLRPGSLRISLLPMDVPQAGGLGAIVGRVLARDSGGPLADAVVTLVGTAMRTETGADGRFEFQAVTPGRNSLRVERLGMATREDSISILPGGAQEVTVRLSVEPIPLEGFTVTAHSKWLVTAGFFRRQQPGYNGRQWDRSQLDALKPKILQDVLETVPRVINTPGHGYMYRGRCRMTVFVDDIIMPAWFDVDMIEPDRVEALEVYSRQGAWMPMEYDAYCGVILVWLRH